MPSWKDYEKEVYEWFREEYPSHEILYDQKLEGRLSKVQRQVDVLVRLRASHKTVIGVFDCKQFNRRDITTIDGMVGFLADVNAAYGEL